MTYEYIQFLNEKIVPYIPTPYVKNGDRINFRCPFCGDSKKSLTKKRAWYYLSNSSFYCFNCGTALSGIKLLEQFSGDDYNEIKKEYIRLFLKSGLNTALSAFSTTTTTEPSLFKLKNTIPVDWKHDLTDDAKTYLENRKVLNAPFLHEKLFSTFNKEKTKEFILIPWRINGIDAYYQVNDFKKFYQMKYIFPKNTKKLVYGLDNVDPTFPYIFVFEGVYDSLFVKNGIASGTKAITDYQMKLIKERWPRHRICCSFDNDKAGISSMIKMIENNVDVDFFKWFNANTAQKDINEYVLYKNDVNIFSDSDKLSKMIVNGLQMKMYLLQNGQWKHEASFHRTNLNNKMNNSFSLLEKKSVFKL